MNQGKYVFAQITEFLPQRVFDKYVSKYSGNKYVRHFSCWNQLLTMIFGQLANRDSLRDLVLTLEAHNKKVFHLGLGKSITRSNLSKANEKRNSKIFEEFAYYLIDVARKKQVNNDFEIQGKIYAFDSTTIDLCISVFWWAKFRTTKGGIKMHTLFEINTQVPVFIHITPAIVHDVNALDLIPYENNAYYIFDRGYVDFARLYKIDLHTAYFVIRAKNNLKFSRMYSRKSDKENGILIDQIGKLVNYYALKNYPKKLRRVKYYDKETNKTFVFLTNNFDLEARQIALLYKNRWQIELFFKWIKQHLKIKSFWGTTENAVRIQIYTAITTYCLVSIIAKDLKVERSTYEILQILGISLLDKTPVNELLTNEDYKDVKELNTNQLKINFF
jgi:hypothetical protein